jgi:serine/threonine protein kinase, bacterial
MSKAERLEVGVEPYAGYRLRRFLGRGGFGEVWEADGPAGKPVALKFLPCESGAKASQESRSLQTVRQLRHPNLIRIDNIWCYPGYLVVAMELADGSLHDLFDIYQAEFGTPIARGHLVPFLAQAAAGLDFLNTRQHRFDNQCVALQHCDVKPSNLLVFNEVVKLTDFSLASMTTSVMRTHHRAGTPAFMAPEMFQGRLSNRTDQYALALTYCMLGEGRLPFPDPPSSVPRDYVRPTPDLSILPKPEQPIIGRALATTPRDRWPSCTELMAQLQNLGPKSPEVTLSQERREKKSENGSTPSDRRVAMRYSSRLKTTGRSVGEKGNPLWKATIKDISRRGIGLVSETCFPRGTILVLNLEYRTETVSRPVYVRVTRVVKQPGGEWLLGCTFARNLSEEEVQRLL